MPYQGAADALLDMLSSCDVKWRARLAGFWACVLSPAVLIFWDGEDVG